MKRRQQYRLLALVFLGVTVLLVSTVFPLSMNSARIVGMAGQIQADRFQLQRLDPGSPAQVAGLRRGDEVLSIDGRTVVDWWELAESRMSEYLAARSDWDGREIPVVAVREGERREFGITVRPLQLVEFGTYYLPRFAVIVVMIVLTVFLLSSNPKDPTALFIGICFFAFTWWMIFDRPNWPEFLSPLVMNEDPTTFLVREVMVTLGMQVALSAIIHVMLVFPRPLLPRQVYRFAIPAVYLVPVVVMGLTMLGYAQSGLIDRMGGVYTVRLWLDSSLLIGLVGLIAISSRGRQTRIQEEQGRLLLRTAVLVALIHVVVWNVPMLVLKSPLVPSYNWMLPIMLLVPVALTVSIANHELFGIRGLIRRRMRYLGAMAQRRQVAVGRRDHMIQALTEEVEQLRQELEDYVAYDESPADDASSTDRMKRLEQEYPAIRQARHENLLGRSPLWLHVFEDAILASRGNIPVLLVGESGTGKTELARTIRALGDRAEAPYREISCAQFEHSDPAFALGRLFGIGKGHGLANTSQEGQPGILEECDGGTLFLDDFDRLPLNAQDLLLYPLEGKPFEPGIGSGPPRQVSLKFILATNRDADELVEQGELRSDVLARMGARVFIPPLRDRPEDLPVLIEHLLQSAADEFEHQIESVSPRAMTLLRSHKYRKGNVRELYAELRTAIGKASLAHDSILRSEYLSEASHEAAREARTTSRPGAATRPAEPTTTARGNHDRHGADDERARELEVLRRHGFHIRPSEEELGLSHKSKTLSNHLRGRCIQALADNDWEPKRAARSLVGSDDPEVNLRVQRKMARFVASIRRSLEQGTENRLFNNLPAAYHAALAATISHLAGR